MLTGKAVARANYSAYGIIIQTSGTLNTPFLWQGAFGVQTDPNGLHHMRARYYHCYMGRFLSEDPLGLAAGPNVYAYCDGNPIMAIDPSGLAEVQIYGGVGGTAGYGAGFGIWGHLEGNLGAAIDINDLLNSKIFLHGQWAIMPVGAGAVVTGGTQAGAYYQPTPSPAGVSGNLSAHTEGGVGGGLFIGGSADLGVAKDTGGPIPLFDVTGFGGAKGREGVGLGIYVAAGVAGNYYYASPSLRDMGSWVKDKLRDAVSPFAPKIEISARPNYYNNIPSGLVAKPESRCIR